MRAEPKRHEDGRRLPKRGEVGVYWPNQDRTAIYNAGDFYEDEHLQNLAQDQGADIITE